MPSLLGSCLFYVYRSFFVGGFFFTKDLYFNRHTNQEPFANDSRQTSQGKLAEPHDLFDDADHWFNNTFAQAINGLPDLSTQLVSHPFFGAGCLERRLRECVKEAVHAFVVWFVASSNVGFDTMPFDASDIGFTVEAIAQCRCFGLTYFRRDSIQCW